MFTFLQLLLFMLLSVAIYGQKKIAIDSTLSNNNHAWIAKKKRALLGKFFEMGDFKLLSVKKVKKSIAAKKKEKKFFNLGPLFGKSECFPETITYEITAKLLTDTADIKLDVYMVTVTDIPGFFSKQTETKRRHIDGVSGEVHFRNDSLPWRININGVMFNYPVSGKISAAGEQYDITSVEHYGTKRKKIVLGSQPKGILIKKQGVIDMAAIQLNTKKYVWVKKTASPMEQLVFSMSFSIILQSIDQVR